VQTWGLAALVLTAVALVPVMFVLLIWITLPLRPWGKLSSGPSPPSVLTYATKTEA
jgi:hypothetical protein